MLTNVRRRIKLYFKSIYLKRKKEVILKGYANIKKTIFEGKNVVGRDVNIEKTYLGYGTYIGNESEIIKSKIGKYCSIGMRVKIIIGDHPIDYVTTHPLAYSDIRKDVGFDYKKSIKKETIRKSEKDYILTIGNDVWIGDGVSILNGVKIGDGAVLGAGSLITKDIEPYSVVVGVPGKEIKKRFSDGDIDILLKYQWWNRELKWIEENVDKFVDIKEFIRFIKRAEVNEK